MCCIIEATDRHEASRGFCATAGLTVPDLAVYVEVTGPTPHSESEYPEHFFETQPRRRGHQSEFTIIIGYIRAFVF